MHLTPQSLQHRIQTLQAQSGLDTVTEYLLALSGGLDSTVLLHLLTHIREQLGAPLRAVYVDHGLQAQSEVWAAHCEELCRQWNVDFTSIKVDAMPGENESPEEAARRARYTVLGKTLNKNGVLLTAQHQDDQAETLLIQLLRGAGPRGLAAMPEVASFADGVHLRPLLIWGRDVLQRYAEANSLDWVEDPSNQNTQFDRNFLRQVIVPQLKERWPSASATLSRSAKACAEMVDVLDDYLQVALQECVRSDGALSLSALKTLSSHKCRQLMFAWIRRSGAPVPSALQMAQIENDFLNTREDAQPEFRWAGRVMRRFQDSLYITEATGHDPAQIIDWDLHTPLQLDGGMLKSETGQGEGLRASDITDGVQVRFRQGGERCRLPGRTHTHRLKKLLQDQGVPPWERDRIPLIYVGDQLAAVVGHWYCEPFVAKPGEAGLVIKWQSLAG